MSRTAVRPAGNVVVLPEPPARRTRRTLLVVAASVVALIVAMMLVLAYSPLLAVKTVQFEGNVLTPDKAVRTALDPLKGTPLPQIGPAKVKDLLSGQPAVKDVVVQAEAPSTLQVTVIEYQPVAVIKSGKKYDLVAGDGRRLASVARRADAELPLIDGAKLGGDEKVFASVTRVLSALPASVLKELDHAGAKTIDSVELTLTNGKTVLWGNDDRSADKARVLEAFLGAKQDASVKVYDLSTPDQPVTR
jgi:cell division protein FtsQ